MLMYIQLLIIALIPGVVSVLIYIFQKKGWLDRFSYGFKQFIIGLIMGFIACLGTAYGVDVGGALANTRDAAIVCAGLLFGTPAGILAGLIGGIYRWVAVYWGAGEFTRVACSLACILAGFFAAFMRKYMLDGKMPGWTLGLAAGAVMEVVHINLLFFTNLDELNKTLKVLDALTIPMVVCNAVGVAFPLLVISIISGDTVFYKRSNSKVKISQTVQKWLFVTVVIAQVFSSLFTYSLQAMIAEIETKNTLSADITDVEQDIRDASDANLLQLTIRIGNEINKLEEVDEDKLISMARAFGVAEINLIDANGIITKSSNEEFINYDMNSGEQSAEFMVLLEGESKYVQKYMPISYDEDVSMKYAGVPLKNGGFVQVGYNASQFYSSLKEQVKQAAVNRHITSSGYVVITSEAFNIESCGKDSGLSMMRIDESKEVFGKALEDVNEYETFIASIRGVESFCMYTTSEGYYIIGVLPVTDAFFSRNIASYANVFTDVIIFAVLFAVIYILIRVIVVKNILKINESLARITKGNLDTVVDVRSNEEFSLLSNDINETVDTLKRYIAEAASRIDAELQYAKDIQASALPHISPNFKGKAEYDLASAMFTAKEVGGDFYDFYYIDDTHLAITVADVSGKGIPAALFMMTSKTMLRNMLESGMSVAEAMVQANDRLCEGNEANMFVTVWAAVVDLKTGHITFGNAGHNPPVLRKKDGSFEYVQCKVGLVMAAMEGMPYQLQEMDMEPGDTLYLYTDGVPEATNSEEELYGEDRLRAILNSTYTDDITMEELLAAVKEDVDLFVGDAPQFDDITMLGFKLK